MQPAGELAQVVEHLVDAVDAVRDPLAQPRRRLLLGEPQLERERHEPLLRAVVQVALEAPPGLVGGDDDPLA